MAFEGEPTEPERPNENLNACDEAHSLGEEACIMAPLLQAIVCRRGATFIPPWMRATLLYTVFTAVCVCVCMCTVLTSVQRRGACQDVLAVSSPSNRGIGDVNPWLSVSLVFKSQWDIQKLSTIRKGLCRGQAGFIAQHLTLYYCGSLSEWSL